jgi:hypothetical protein
MVPQAFITLPSLPLTPNGKLDRRGLPQPDAADSETAYRAPRSPREIMLCGLFETITGSSRVGLDDSFFGVGGHSLLAMQLIAQLRRDLGTAVPLRLVFTHPTPEAFAAALEALTPSRAPRLRAGMGRISQDRRS